MLVQKKIKSVYLGDVKVRPTGWQPGSNTVAYYPLTSSTTTSDMKTSGTKYNLTNNNVTFGTYQGVNCGYFNARGSSSGYCGLYNSSFTPRTAGPRTVSLWFYASGNTTYNNPRLMSPLVWAKDKGTKIIGGWYNNGDINGANFTIGQWTNVIFTWNDNNHYDVYKNGNLQYSNVYTSGMIHSNYLTIGTRDNNGTQYGDKFDGGISEVIIENKERTAEEIAKYYNQTKSNYGL